MASVSRKRTSSGAAGQSPRFRKTGVLTRAELSRLGRLPGRKRLEKGPVVVIECVENIPCNPCVAACPRKAITMPGGLTGLPEVDYELCTGCTMCVARCPGLAIFVVNLNYSKTEAAVTIPYELLPWPAVGSRVAALDRSGRQVARARVLKVLDAKALDRCAVVTVAVPKRLWNEVRSIKVNSELRTTNYERQRQRTSRRSASADRKSKSTSQKRGNVPRRRKRRAR